MPTPSKTKKNYDLTKGFERYTQTEDEKKSRKRQKDKALKEDLKRKPASGRLKPTFDEAFARYVSGGPGGFGVRNQPSINLSKGPKPTPRGGMNPDAPENNYEKPGPKGIRSAKNKPMPPVRKATTKKTSTKKR